MWQRTCFGRVDHRILKAHRAFWAEKSLCCNKFVSIYTRFKRYVTKIMPRLLHGSSSWAWSQSLYQKLTTWENRCLRNMLGAKRKEGETWVPWIRRTTRAALRLFVSMGFEPSIVRVLKAIHELASKLKTRVPTPCAVGFLADTIPWKDTKRWKTDAGHGPTFRSLGPRRVETLGRWF